MNGGVTLEIGGFKRGIINAIPKAPRISSGNPMINMKEESFPDDKTSVIHVWSPDIMINLPTGYTPLDIYINNNAFKTINEKNNNAGDYYPLIPNGKW